MESLIGDINSLTQLLTCLGTLITAAVGVLTTISVAVKPIRQKIVTWLINLFSGNNQRSTAIDTKLGMFESKLESIQESIDDLKSDVADVKCENQTQNANMELLKHASIDEMKHTLTELYYQAKKDNGISRYNRTNFATMFETYKNLGGNSYVHELYDQIVEMPIIDE